MKIDYTWTQGNVTDFLKITYDTSEILNFLSQDNTDFSQQIVRFHLDFSLPYSQKSVQKEVVRTFSLQSTNPYSKTKEKTSAFILRPKQGHASQLVV